MIQIIKAFGEKPNIGEAVKGLWGYEGKPEYFLTICKGIGFLETPVATETTSVSVKLPECYPFFAQVYSASGVRLVRVDDSVLECTLSAGEQLNTNFKLK